MFPDNFKSILVGDLSGGHQRTVAKIREEAARLKTQPDEVLRQQSSNLQFEAMAGATVNDLLVPAFGLACAAIERVTGLQPFPTQIRGGIELCKPCIVEMATGEGKTLTALMPVFLKSLNRKGLYFATSNDYLARRDADHAQKVFEKLGITVGAITSDSEEDARREAYLRDVTYGTTSEFGFDFLRDRAKRRHSVVHGVTPETTLVGRGTLNAIIVDEADALLIDDAATPMVISSAKRALPEYRRRLFQWAHATSTKAVLEKHYLKNSLKDKVELNDPGRAWVRQMAQDLNFERISLLDLFEYVERAILVNTEFIRDKKFIIRDDEIIIVDENTGRLGIGREWSEGMQQAIQAKEGLEITGQSGHLAKISVQNFIRAFKFRSGLTGTAVQSAREFKKIYKLKVKPIPTFRKCLRKQDPAVAFRRREDAFDSVVQRVAHFTDDGRPVLIGTRTIKISEQMSSVFSRNNVPHTLLNAKNDSSEAEIISVAGEAGRITIATNMAGRGTDIILDDVAKRAGGLHVIVLGIHNSKRIDRQLVGRCARQGDPGSFHVVHFADDDLVDIAFGPEIAQQLRQEIGNRFSSESCIRLLRDAQRKVTRRLESNRATMLHQEKKMVKQLSNAGFDPILEIPG